MENAMKKPPYQYDEPIWKIWKHKRYIVAILSFIGFMNIYALRTNLSIAIVDMTSVKNTVLPNGTIISEKEFNWDSTIQGYVLSSFFYGYILTQFLGGWLATKCGGARLFGFGIAATSIFTLISPLIAKTNVYLFIVFRILEGAFEGVTYPSTQELWSHWAPPAEKSRLVSFAGSGAYFGAVVAMPVCSLLATNLNWEAIFYVFGTLGLVWYLVWAIVVRDTPTKDSNISEKELTFITESIKLVKSDVNVKIPWVKILTSKCFLATTICMSCETWGFYTMLTFLPQVMKSLLGFDLNEAGFLSAVPYLLTSLSMQLSGYLSDFILAKGYMNTTNVRKLFVILGFICQGSFILIAGYWVTPVGIPLCLIVGVGLGGTAVGAVMINFLDIAPKFASVMFGIANTVGTVPGIVSPIITGYIVTDSTNIMQWRIVFYIASGLYFFGVMVSFFFMSGVKQPWAEGDENTANGDKKI
ncbi:unnamed protein product [Phyllotreta striolata]|uniref:Sialin n=1 Tax=Phyllotreta striolata TaxID=444603 RepID=A0A9N9XWJ1_PHYSR|nr:unnamed protein product [Phyllotreta striolata]